MTRWSRLGAAVLASMLVASPLLASASVRRSPYKSKMVDVYIVDEPLTSAIDALEMFLPFRVQMLIGADPHVTVRAREVPPEAALRRIVAAAGVQLESENGMYWIRDHREPSVTLDVKDADVRVILKTMQKQCGIRNLMIDPDVQGSGTFLFTDVPCETAFRTVLRSLGLATHSYENSVLAVGTQKR